MDKILVVDDDTDIHAIVRSLLETDYQVETVESADAAQAHLAQSPVDLLILDVEMPGENGFEFFRRRLQDQDMPVIFLTSRGAVADKVHGLELGADDYIVKPFEPHEFKARVASKLKKQSARNRIQVGDLSLDLSKQTVNIGDKQTTTLTPLEFKLLVHLARSPDTPIARDQLLAAAWGKGVHVVARAVDTHLSRLRKKISASNCEITSKQRASYQLVVRKKAA